MLRFSINHDKHKNMALTKIKYTIGKVAARLAVSSDTLRHYEKNGLLAPISKTVAGYRLYNEDTVYRVHFIKQAQSCGLRLADIRKLLRQINEDKCYCSDVYKLATERKLWVNYKLAELETMSRALDILLENCKNGDRISISNCPIFGTQETYQKKERAM